VHDALAALNPDDLSPREALEALYRLKSLAAKGDK
jgi:DNA mismatch repair protein MutS